MFGRSKIMHFEASQIAGTGVHSQQANAMHAGLTRRRAQDDVRAVRGLARPIHAQCAIESCII